MIDKPHSHVDLPLRGFIRQSQLIPHIIPISPATLWRKVKKGTFPCPVKLSERVTAWRVDDIRSWMQCRNGENVNEKK